MDCLVRSLVRGLKTTVLCFNVQFVQPMCCCLVLGKEVTMTFVSEQKLMTCSVVYLNSPRLHEGPSSASRIKSDRGVFVVDFDEPNSVDDDRGAQ